MTSGRNFGLSTLLLPIQNNNQVIVNDTDSLKAIVVGKLIIKNDGYGNIHLFLGQRWFLILN